jgi:hypothetical protein
MERCTIHPDLGIFPAEDHGAAIDPAVERKLTLTRMARWSRGPNRALGADGLCIATTGLKIDYPALLSICRQRAGIPAIW